jgi:pimeloyl-ACP methyl ester carboxylesterase
MVTRAYLTLADGRTLRTYDTGVGDLVVIWHHGTPNIGLPPEPLFPTSDRLGIRWVSYDRPGYGGSTRAPGRTVATAAGYTAAVADRLGIERFAVMGHSGGGPHALACAALMPDRVVGVVSGAALAPIDAEGLDWYAGMTASGVAALRAAAAGLAAKEAYEASGVEYDAEWAPADLAAFEGDWSWFGKVVGPAVESGPGGHVDDDIAYVTPWGCDPSGVVAPVLVLHGGRDRVVPASHGEWLARRMPSARLRLSPDDGHVSVLNQAADALEWLHSVTR